MRIAIAALLAVLPVLPPAHAAAAARAQGQPPAAAPPAAAPQEAPAPDPSLAPDAFLKEVARTDLLQIELGRLAASQADGKAVREYGQRMLTNHNAIQAIIARLAGKEGVALPSVPGDEGAEAIRRLGALRGTEFDKAYVMFVAELHPRTLAMYRWQADNGTDAEVKAFAAQTAPIVGTHVRLGDLLNQDVNREELRIAAERRAEAQRAEQARKAQEAADAAAAAAGRKKPSAKKPPAKS